MEKQGTGKGRRRSVYGRLKKHRLLALVITVCMCVLSVFSLFQVIKFFAKVKEFDVVGISIYDKTDLINASGIKRGVPLYSLDQDAVETRILEECPYLESVEVELHFPNKVRFRVEGKSAQWYLDISGTKYALDSDLKVISETERIEGVTKLILPSIQSAMYGEVPGFGESEIERKRTLEMISAIRQTPFKTRLSEVDLENRWDVWLTVDGRYRISMGDGEDFDAKLRAVEAILNQETVKNAPSGTITIVKGTGGYTGAFSPE